MTACTDKQIEYRVPTLGEHDRARLTCEQYPDFVAVLQELPPLEFMRTGAGIKVVTPDGNTWVTFNSVQQRDSLLVKFGGVTAKNAHFQCWDNLLWVGDMWTTLEK